jgi:hypothetical protein
LDTADVCVFDALLVGESKLKQLLLFEILSDVDNFVIILIFVIADIV